MNEETRGKCYTAARELYRRLGGKAAGLTPMMCYVREPYGPDSPTTTHWYLRWQHEDGTTYYIDPTADQFALVPDYASGRGYGFRGVKA